MNICESLTATAKIFPDKTAIIYAEQKISYRQLNQWSASAAEFLSQRGIGVGQRVALMLPNTRSFPIWYYAVLRIGAVAVSLSTKLAAAEIEFIVNDCEAKVLLASTQSLETLRTSHSSEIQQIAVDECSGEVINSDFRFEPTVNSVNWHDAEPNDAALILYTSGTTGFPKGATLSHANVRSNVSAFNHLCKMRAGDRVLLAVPLFHCFGQNALLNSVLNVGGTIILQQRFDLNESKRLIADWQINQLYGVPMMFSLLLESCAPNDLKSVDYCFSAAAPLNSDVENGWYDKFGLPIYQGYGLTETSPFATYNDRDRYLSGSIGRPIDNVEIRIVDTETGQRCQSGQLGEIAIRGPNVMIGYWNRPEETEAAIKDGWFHSGDIGKLDEQGYLFIVDRVKDMIAVGGMKVFPAEVERVIQLHPAVDSNAVVGVADAVFGESVVAFVVLNDSSCPEETLEQIKQHAKSHLGNYKVPRQMIAIEGLPRNAAGKVLKTELREMAAKQFGQVAPADSTAEPSAVASAAILQTASLVNQLHQTHPSERISVATRYLQELVAKTDGQKTTPGPDDTFIGLGLDSLAIVDLSTQLQIDLGDETSLAPTLLFDHPRISDLAAFVVESIFKQSGVKENAAAMPSKTTLQSEIEQMNEQEALQELMKELE